MSEIKATGPFFDGRIQGIVDAYLDEAKRAVAREGEQEVQRVLPTVLRNPSGYYQSQIYSDRAGDNYVVSDDHVIYGPWLEGVSSRNRTTRFKGYATFRKVTQKLQREVPFIAEKILPHYLRRMN